MENDVMRKLVDKYMAGMTSNEEERLLREYFSALADVPEEWKPLKALFSFVDSERMRTGQGEGRASALAPVSPGIVAKSKLPQLRGRLYGWVALAAAMALVVVMTPLLRQTSMQPRCYAVIDGKVYTDPQVVHDEALDALRDMSDGQEDDFGALKMLE